MARERIQFHGLPARICWVGLGDRHRLGLAFNEMVASGEVKAPVVIGRDHLDSGSVASPNRETEAMRDGSDAVSDWPPLNGLLNTASGATWVSLHHGGGVGMAYSQHAGMVIVADGARSSRPARAGAVERSRQRGHAPRRCGLSDRHELCGGDGSRSSRPTSLNIPATTVGRPLSRSIAFTVPLSDSGHGTSLCPQVRYIPQASRSSRPIANAQMLRGVSDPKRNQTSCYGGAFEKKLPAMRGASPQCVIDRRGAGGGLKLQRSSNLTDITCRSRILTHRSRVLGSSMMRSVVLLSAAAVMTTPAMAQDPEPATDEQAAAEVEIVVTGSRIARKDYLANSPIVTLTQEDIKATGSTNIETLINELPQFTPLGSASSNSPNVAGQAQVQLRGLGAIRTLVLLNGRRVVSSSASSVVDLNVFPTALISNVETITGGASSTYGSDAVAGVLNFQLNKKFDGVLIDAQAGISDRGDAASQAVSLTVGQDIAAGRGNVVLSLGYSNRDSVLNAAREFSLIGGFAGTSPLGSTVFDATNLPSAAAVSAAVPGAARGNTFGFNNDGTLFAYQGARDYLSPGGVGYDGFRTPGPLQQSDFAYATADRNYMIIPQQRYNLYAATNYEISPFAEVYTDFLFSQYEANNQLASNPATGPTTGFRIPAANPFIPAELRAVLNSRSNPAGSFRLDKRFNELGPRRQNEKYDVYQITAGLRGRVPSVGDWTYDAYLSYGRVDNSTTYTGYLSRSATQLLLDAPDGGVSLCEGGFNPFGEKPLSGSCIAYVSRVPTNSTTNDQLVAELNLQGGLFSLPAGEVRAAVGATYREQNYTFVPDPMALATFTLNGVTGPELAGLSSQPLSGSDKVREVYGELLIPLLRDIPLIRSLETNLGYRISDYDTIGSVSTYKADLSWEIFDGLRVRGGIQRAVRAPSLGELFAAQSLSFPNIGVPVSSAGVRQFSGDPCDIRGAYRAPSSANASQVRALCVAQGVPGQVVDAYTFSNSQVSGLTGGNPSLKEETADSFTIGATLRSPFSSPWLSGLSASIDYYDIKIEQVVGTLATTEQLRRCFNENGTSNPTYDPNNFFCQLFSRDPNSGQITGTLETNANLGTLKTSGIDFQVDWALTLADVGAPNWGSFAFNFVGTKLEEWKRQDIPGGNFTDRMGTISNAFGLTLPEWKFLSALNWNYDPLTVGLRWRYVGSVENFNNREQVLGAVNYFDLNTSVKVNERMTLRAGVNNLTDAQPPVYSPSIAANTDPSTYDLVGRRYYVGITARF